MKNRFFPADKKSLGLPPNIIDKPISQKLGAGISSATIQVKVSGAGNIEVAGMIIPPDFGSSKAKGFESWDELKLEEVKFDPLEIGALQRTGGLYEAKHNKFTKPGLYTITITAENEDGSSTPVETTIEVPENPCPWDVNQDKEVNIFDMVIVASNFGQDITSPPPDPNPDVTRDGKVDIFDLVLIGTHFGEKCPTNAPNPLAPASPTYAADEALSEALSDVNLLIQLRDLLKALNAMPNQHQNSGILKAIAELEKLIAFASDKNLLTETKLFANYPNPFNPETWIPYRLAEESEVVIRIYNASGQLVRTLSLGRKGGGYYIKKEKAGYWDGRNELRELVASGMYFYTLEAGKFIATRRMVVVK